MSAITLDSGNPAPEVALGQDAQPAENPSMRAIGADYLTTNDAAEYLCHSVSWLLRQGDIPYLRGRPNLYSRRDLDAWFERNKYSPRLR